MLKNYECTQCGSTDFEDAGFRRVRCAHCGSLYEVLTDDPKLTILPGADVIFEKGADVEIHGDVEVQPGAKVDVQGKITLLKGNQKRSFQLRLIPPDGKPKD
jgi:rubredoxin